MAFVIIGLLALGVLVFQLASATNLATEGQTAADAAALGAENVVAQELEQARSATGADLSSSIINPAAVRAAAESWASNNSGTLVGFQLIGFDVLVTVQTEGTLHGSVAAGVPAVDRARASMGGGLPIGLPSMSTDAQLPTASSKPIADNPPAAPARTGSSFISPATLAALSSQAGVAVRPDSALRRYGGVATSTVTADVSDLQPAMQEAILKVEAKLGRGLTINSAYRSSTYDAQLCHQGADQCSDPGRGLADVGLAIDVPIGEISSSVAAAANLCEPFPASDPGHLSLASGPECQGQTGVLSSNTVAGAQPFGGNVAGFIGPQVHLVPLTGSGLGSALLLPGGPVNLNLSQLQIGCSFYAVGQSLHVSQNVLFASLLAGWDESGMRNIPYGTGTSVGVLQQQAADGWGTLAQEMNPADAVAMFYQGVNGNIGAIQVDQQSPGISPWLLAQTVQKSGAGQYNAGANYQAQIPEATAMLNQIQHGACNGRVAQ